MSGVVNVLATALNQLVVELANAVPKVLVAILIWVAGKYLINLAVRLVRKIDIKGTEIDDKLLGVFTSVVAVLGKFFLVLIILDYLGIGQAVIGALANGLTITVAIALGLAFGRALEPDVKKLVEIARGHLHGRGK